MALIRKLGIIVGIIDEMIGASATAALKRDGAPSELLEALDAKLGRDANLGSYQTAPLTAYATEHRDLAERIFAAAAAQLPPSLARRYKGSHSFFAPSPDKTVAKIIIFERGLGKVNHNVPIDRDGVYVLLRVHGESDKPTIGVAPKHAERFTYRLVGEADVDAAARDIVAAVAQAAKVVASR